MDSNSLSEGSDRVAEEWVWGGITFLGALVRERLRGARGAAALRGESAEGSEFFLAESVRVSMGDTTGSEIFPANDDILAELEEIPGGVTSTVFGEERGGLADDEARKGDGADGMPAES